MSATSDFNQTVIDEFRANHGKVGAFGDATVVLLTTTGAKSGRTRVTPVVGLPRDNGTIYVFASKAGAPTNPDWYHNLLAHPKVTIEVGDDSYAATATPVTGAERDRIYEEQATNMPNFREYEEKTTRVIPVIALTRD